LEAPAALPLEQRRIAPRAGHPDDLLARLGTAARVDDRAAPDGRRPVAVHERALFELAVDLEREPLDLRVRRQRKAVHALQHLVARALEGLVDLGAREAAGD